MSVYSLLNSKAKAWWYHAQLWRQGKPAEARRRERESILSTVHSLRGARTGGCMVVGDGVWFLYSGDDGPFSSISTRGYGDMNSPTAEAAVLCGVPVVDASALSTGQRLAAPLYRNTASPREMLGWADLSSFLQYYATCGAIIHNHEATP